MSGFTEKAAETVPELNATLATYRGQLKQVEGLLETDHGNDEILKIRSDVLKAISLTEQKLVEARAVEAKERVKSYVVGAYVVVSKDDKWITCSITDVPKDNNDEKTYIVTPVGQTDTLLTAAADMRPWRPPTHVKKGDYIEAILPTMGCFHPAKIDAVTSTGTVWVIFKNTNNNIEEVPLPHIRYPKKKGSAAHLKKTRDDTSGIQPLAVEKKQKRNEEWKARIEEANQVQESGRNDWKSFMGGKKMSKKVGMRTGVSKGQSIFSTEQGDKIGVSKKR